MALRPINVSVEKVLFVIVKVWIEQAHCLAAERLQFSERIAEEEVKPFRYGLVCAGYA